MKTTEGFFILRVSSATLREDQGHDERCSGPEAANLCPDLRDRLFADGNPPSEMQEGEHNAALQRFQWIQLPHFVLGIEVRALLELQRVFGHAGCFVLTTETNNKQSGNSYDRPCLLSKCMYRSKTRFSVATFLVHRPPSSRPKFCARARSTVQRSQSQCHFQLPAHVPRPPPSALRPGMDGADGALSSIAMWDTRYILNLSPRGAPR